MRFGVFLGKSPGLLHGPYVFTCRLFLCFSNACRFAQSNVLLVLNTWAKQLFALCVESSSAFPRDPGRCLAVSLQPLLVAGSGAAVNLGNCPSVQHLCMLLRRLQGCECPSRTWRALLMSIMELQHSQVLPWLQRCRVSLALRAEEHRAPGIPGIH